MSQTGALQASKYRQADHLAQGFLCSSLLRLFPHSQVVNSFVHLSIEYTTALELTV
jgi:hypothetical protein